MKRIYTISLFLLSIVLIAACDKVDVSSLSDDDLTRLSEKAIVCNEPYIRFGMSCCLDQDNNNICDEDEKTVVKKGKPKEEPTEDTNKPKNIPINLLKLTKVSGGPAGWKGNILCFDINNKYKGIGEKYSILVDGKEYEVYCGEDAAKFCGDWLQRKVFSSCSEECIGYLCYSQDCLDDIYSGKHTLKLKVEADSAVGEAELDMFFHKLNFECVDQASDCGIDSRCINHECIFEDCGGKFCASEEAEVEEEPEEKPLPVVLLLGEGLDGPIHFNLGYIPKWVELHALVEGNFIAFGLIRIEILSVTEDGIDVSIDSPERTIVLANGEPQKVSTADGELELEAMGRSAQLTIKRLTNPQGYKDK